MMDTQPKQEMRQARLNLSTVKLHHEIWRNHLITFLNGGRPPTAMSHRDCEFGKWLYGGGLEAYGSFPEMHRLEQKHQAFHDQVRRVIEAQQAGDRKQAWSAYEALKPLSNELMELLDGLGKRLS